MFFCLFFFQSFLFTINCLSVSHNLLLWWFTVMKGHYYSSKGSTFSLTLSYVFIGRSYVFLQTTSYTRRKVVGDISFLNLLCNMTHQAAYRHILQNRSQPFIRFSETVFQLGIPPFASNIRKCSVSRRGTISWNLLPTECRKVGGWKRYSCMTYMLNSVNLILRTLILIICIAELRSEYVDLVTC